MEALLEPFGADVSSIITDYLTLTEMRAYNMPVTRAILARIVTSFKNTPLTVVDYKSLMFQEYGPNVIEADILLNNPPREFLEEVGLYMRFPQYINDLIVKRFLWEYTPEKLNQLSIIISRYPDGGMYRQPRRSPDYHPDQGIDQTFNETTLRRIIKRYLNDKVDLPECLSNFLIETGHDQLIHKITQQSHKLLNLRYVERALAYDQDVIANYILGEMLDEQTKTQRYDLLSDVSPTTILSLVKLVNALASDSRFMSHLEAYISNIPLVYKNRYILQALLNDSRIFKHTSREFWLNIAALSRGHQLHQLILESLERIY